ncbi:MAG: Uma2 family endonuclease [Acidobacteria bacterium]|nr:Uma2 family endonuclease [Acidobacteriota bacterium]
MTAKPKAKYISPEEYLAMEREALEKHEYYNGEIFLMSGAKRNHVYICSNILVSLAPCLKDQNCRIAASDLRVHIPTTGLYTYPDVTIVCGGDEFLSDGHFDTLLNPKVIIEVLSPSTESYDRGAKFDHYKTIDSLKEYVLVWQDKKRAARYTRRDDDSWVLTDLIGDDAAIELVSVGCSLSMNDIYDRIEFDEHPQTEGSREIN